MKSPLFIVLVAVVLVTFGTLAAMMIGPLFFDPHQVNL
jgi:hypothetical protein